MWSYYNDYGRNARRKSAEAIGERGVFCGDVPAGFGYFLPGFCRTERPVPLVYRLRFIFPLFPKWTAREIL